MFLFAWDGFPQYAARCVGAFVRSSAQRVVVIATRPHVPIQGMENVCKCEVHWVGSEDVRTLKEIAGEVPHAAVVSGWSIPLFNRYRDEIHGQGGKVFSICDNNCKFSAARQCFGIDFLKECAKAVRFRARMSGLYEAFFVPGRSSRKLLRFYGVPDEKIVEGVYSADASLFTNGAPLPERAKKIIYVGQFIERKNVRRLVQAFRKANVPGWTLEMYGSGPLKDELIKIAAPTLNSQPSTLAPRVLIHDFVQPEQLAALYQSAPIFCLPSLWEHWGLVVHEAALSGCVLLLGNRTGAADDLLGETNGELFDPYSVDSMAGALKRAMNMSDAELLSAQEESLRLAKTVSIDRFVAAVKKMGNL